MAKATVNVEGNTLVFDFAVGQALRANLDELPPAIVHRLALHGLEQKIRDSYAGAEPEEAPGYAQKVWDNLRAGVWGRVAGPKGESLLVKAVKMVLEAKGKPVPPGLDEAIENLSRGDKIKLRRDPEVAAAIAKLRPGAEGILDSILS